ncbi:MAG: S8 family serine peptidase [Proteobacteria bacterium]|nr:S8 family serine peptidase [Pseudomonadota bacterium]
MAHKKSGSIEQKELLSIKLGGEALALVKSSDYFAVRKLPGAQPGMLKACATHAKSFHSLNLRNDLSTEYVEVYRVDGELDEAMDTLRVHSDDVAWCSHVFHVVEQPDGLMIPSDTVYIKTIADVDQNEVNTLLMEFQLAVVSVDTDDFVSADTDDPTYILARLTSASRYNPIKIAVALEKSKHIEIAEPDFAVKMALKAYRPSDPLFPKQWHLENEGGLGKKAGADVSAPEAWEISRGDQSVVISVMDDGVDVSHDDFSSPGKIVSPRDFGQGDYDASPVHSGRGSRGDNHGTACAGVAVADENGRGVVGIAPNCGLMPIRTSGVISSDTIESLFAYAVNQGADVISCSWGVASPFFTLTTRMKRAITRAAARGRNGKGCVIVFAAGNEDSPLDGTKDGVRVRSGFALHPDVIAVSASTSNDVRSHYSNYGPEVWVCAPSSGAGGWGILTTDRSGVKGYESGDYTLNDPFGGTSSSTPLVAGICGLVLSVNPELKSDEVKEILRQTSDRIDTDGGLYNSEGHSEYYGWGRVNSKKALEEARRRLAPPSIVRQVAYESRPFVDIPDDYPAGVNDTITVDDSGAVVWVQLSLEITHTYQGDLIVDLIGPDGTTVTVHNRTGGTRDNLFRAYTREDTPALSAFEGTGCRGPWSLVVRDLAPVDVGTLDSWTLSLGIKSSHSYWEASPGMAIEDDDLRGIVSTLSVQSSGVLKDIELFVDITHTYRGDLVVELESPTGRRVKVHGDGDGGSEDNLKRTYRQSDTPILKILTSENSEIQGDWKLHVADHAPVDVGKLNRWSLKLYT